jgi:hypothetical protein
MLQESQRCRHVSIRERRVDIHGQAFQVRSTADGGPFVTATRTAGPHEELLPSAASPWLPESRPMSARTLPPGARRRLPVNDGSPATPALAAISGGCPRRETRHSSLQVNRGHYRQAPMRDGIDGARASANADLRSPSRTVRGSLEQAGSRDLGHLVPGASRPAR